MFNITQEEELQSNLLQQTSSATSAPTESENDCFALATTKKRNLPGNPDPDAEVIALSPRSLMATNRYTCEICHKGFQRDQNLQLHRRGHNLPWKLKQRLAGAGIKKRVYVCPEPGCIHHDPTRALGDLTGIKKHFCRKHGEKKWKCEKCCKCYAVQSDWKAHGKICGTREYHCDCGTIFSRKDSFITHRAFCDALAEENYKVNQGLSPMGGEILHSQTQELLPPSLPNSNSCSDTNTMISLSVSNHNTNNPPNPLSLQFTFSSNGEEIFEQGTPQHPFLHPNPGKTACLSPLNVLNNTHMAIGSSYMSATAMLQKAAVMGSTVSDDLISPVILKGFTGYSTTLRSYGSVLGPKNASPTPTSSSVVGNQNEFENYFEYSNMDFGPPSVLQGGLMDSPMSSKPGHHNQLVGAERMTLDFLGLRPLENLSIGNQSCVDGDTGGLRYSDEERNLHSMHSHHHISHDQTTMENPMWNF